MTVILAALIAEPVAAQFEANRRPPRPDVTLPEGPVRQVILRSCTQCHGIDEYGYYAMDRASWLAVIERMKTAKSGIVEGTVISDADRELLLDWLVAEFGPDSEPLPRQYVIRELAEHELFSESEGRALLESACAGCHSDVEAVAAAARPIEDWRLMLMEKISTGTPLLIEDAEPFAQWLTGRRRN